ncbi:MAG: LamG-like jellyroll fold domain-containing protein [Bacteroidales bacterium]
MKVPIFLLSLLSLWFCRDAAAQFAGVDLEKAYDERVFLVSNYSGVDATAPEQHNLVDLLGMDVDGFRLLLEQVDSTGELVLKEPDGSRTALSRSLALFRTELEKRPGRVLTLFLDFDFPWEYLDSALKTAQLEDFVFALPSDGTWPPLVRMLSSGKRLVLFSMQNHGRHPLWLPHLWDHAIQPLSLSVGDISFPGETFDGSLHKRLMVYNGFNTISVGHNPEGISYFATQRPFFIESLKSAWISNGKTPNFILLDRYDSSMAYIIQRIREFRSVRGTVSYSGEVLDYVNWEGLGSLSNGNFSFVIPPGEELLLVPRSPGFTFDPEQIRVDENTPGGSLSFKAKRLRISHGLEACYPFENNVLDASGNKNHGESLGFDYAYDSERGWVGELTEGNFVRLVDGEALHMRDHDFTVAMWVKIPEYLPGKTENTILASQTLSYQSGLHLVVRNRKPYMGFFNDDLAGKVTLEEGIWYHLVFRYNKLSNEQAIYVNGVPDASALRRPSYKGTDTLYIGAHFNPGSNFQGQLNDLCIWSRALGDREIARISDPVFHLEAHLGLFRKVPLIQYAILLFIVAAMIALGFLIYRRRTSLLAALGTEEVSKPERETIPDAGERKNYIGMFGDFMVLDREGKSITGRFTPKLKQLFLILLVYSQREGHCISTRELSEILWEGQSPQQSKNIRGVTIRNLRLVLEQMDSMEIRFKNDSWCLKLSGRVRCDFLEFFELVHGDRELTAPDFARLTAIIEKGEILRGESYPWFDETKGYVGSQIVDSILNYLEAHADSLDPDSVLRLTWQVWVYDPTSDLALSHHMKALIRQNKLKMARFMYERFCHQYQESYAEAYQVSFQSLVS